MRYLLISLAISVSAHATWAASQLRISDIVTDKARYAPGEAVRFFVHIENPAAQTLRCKLTATVQDCGRAMANIELPATIDSRTEQEATFSLAPPAGDFHGYRVEVHLRKADGTELAEGATAVDVSSDWTHFPRYGYLAHFDEKVPVEQWLYELNRFHIDGLQYYDFQYKHHLPFAAVEPPMDEWHDIANRTTSRKTLLSFLLAAKKYHMVNMAYNASYAAYENAFRDGSGVKLQWAAWDNAGAPRTEASLKAFRLPPNWATPKLIYMNQNDAGWQRYIFSKMADLLAEFPFDGWHIDTYGDAKAYAYDRSLIDYVSGFPDFVDNARAALNRRILLNTVGGHGEIGMAHSAADFVHSELWPGDHDTYASILQAADEIHAANKQKAVVFAAYLHRKLSDELKDAGKSGAHFDLPAALLANAVIFSAGASHMELGDGLRMLSNPYYPADTAITMSPELIQNLRSYYDFLVAYENYLRDGMEAASFSVDLSGAKQTRTGEAGAVWTIAREKDDLAVIHLINLTALKKTNWVDDNLDYPSAPLLHDLRLRVKLPADIVASGWASPDFEDGKWHEAAPEHQGKGLEEIRVPRLRYWTTIILRTQPRNPAVISAGPSARLRHQIRGRSLSSLPDSQRRVSKNNCRRDGRAARSNAKGLASDGADGPNFTTFW